MKKADVFPSKYLKNDDLNGKPITVTIERAPLEPPTLPPAQDTASYRLAPAPAYKIAVKDHTVSALGY